MRRPSGPAGAGRELAAMPGWQIALIAATVAVLVDRARTARRKSATTAA